jgi:hypothetical protein
MSKICNFCGDTTTKQNWARHKKSKTCSAYQKAVRSFNKLLLEDDTKIKSLSDLVKRPYTDKNGKVIYLNDMQLKFIKKLK